MGIRDVGKRLLLGRKLRNTQLGETLLPKRIALPVFASDALSSVGYAPDEIFLTLSVAGGAFATTHSWQIGLAVVFVMLIVVASYRLTLGGKPVGSSYTQDTIIGQLSKTVFSDFPIGVVFFTPGVMMTSVPWQLRSSEGVEERYDGPTVGSVRRGE